MLIEVQDTLLTFHHTTLGKDCASIAAIGSSLRDDMLWLKDIYEEAVDDIREILEQDPSYSMAFQLLSCSKESANIIHFWQCSERPYLMQSFGTFSKRYC
jgi:hypothetical protein